MVRNFDEPGGIATMKLYLRRTLVPSVVYVARCNRLRLGEWQVVNGEWVGATPQSIRLCEVSGLRSIMFKVCDFDN